MSDGVDHSRGSRPEARDDFAEETAGPAARRLGTVYLQGVRLNAMTKAQCVAHMLDELDAGRGGWLITQNLSYLRRSSRDPAFAALCSKATLSVADGMPLLWACALQGTPLPDRIAGSDLVLILPGAAAQRGRSVYLLGGSPGTAHETARILKMRQPGARVAGVCCPPIGFERDPQEIARIQEELTGTKPDIVFVALGTPKQDYLIDELRPVLPSAWWLGVGVSFSFVAGRLRRAPLWVQRAGP